MNLLARTLNAGIKAMSLPMGSTNSAGRGGAYRTNFFGGLLPGAKIDYQRKAGDPWKNAVISASLGWIGRNISQAPPCVYRELEDGEEEVVPKHPLTAILKYPNKYYDGRTLRQATFLSLIAGRGNAYWWVKRDNIGRALEFWWLPHWEVWPLWSSDSTTDKWITGYGYRNNGVSYTLKENEIIHFRDGMDPENPRYGLDPTKAASREIVTDNEAAGYAAQLLGNMCIPGAIIYPKGGAEFEQPDMEDFKANFEEQSGGENRFRPVVMTAEIGVEKMSFTPENMSLSTMQDRPEARLCAMIGVNPIVLGFTVGLDHSKYSNMVEARAGAWEDGIIPRLELIHSELDRQILSHYPDSEGLRVGARYDKVPALQDMLLERMARFSLAIGGPWVKPNEGRTRIGLKSIPEGDELYPVKGSPQFGDPGSEGGNASQAIREPQTVGNPSDASMAKAWNVDEAIRRAISNGVHA